jgi:RND family efflux transporter MFP subunit
MTGRFLRILLPILLIVIGVATALIIVKLRPHAQTAVPESIPPLVRVRTLHPENIRLSVHSQGSVVPRTQTTLAPQVSGSVMMVSPSFVSGGFVKEGELLVQIDPLDFEIAVIQASSAVARAQVRVAREKAEARVAEREWQALGKGEASPLAKRDLQKAEADAEYEAALASLRQAKANLERTRLTAPFDGRVRSKNVDVGQFVATAQPLGVVYSIDIAEVRLPLPDGELAYIDLPLVFREDADTETPPQLLPEVAIRTRFGGGLFEWMGRVVRTEGEIDAHSRMVHVVVQVDDPYGMPDGVQRPPLAVGMFVQAEIYGQTLEDVFVIPRAAVRDRSQVLIVDADDRLHFRDITVVRFQGDEVVVRDGLRDGERICLSPLSVVTEGMRVRSLEEARPTHREEPGAAPESPPPPPSAGATP